MCTLHIFITLDTQDRIPSGHLSVVTAFAYFHQNGQHVSSNLVLNSRLILFPNRAQVLALIFWPESFQVEMWLGALLSLVFSSI